FSCIALSFMQLFLGSVLWNDLNSNFAQIVDPQRSEPEFEAFSCWTTKLHNDSYLSLPYFPCHSSQPHARIILL
ncbi:hypothetical protein B0H13DRAFT_2173876, partial [Mycena leptocephala]